MAIPYESHVLSEREAGMRESEIADGNHPLFEMMENIYVPVSDNTCTFCKTEKFFQLPNLTKYMMLF